jgi:hypothetical protein
MPTNIRYVVGSITLFAVNGVCPPPFVRAAKIELVTAERKNTRIFSRGDHGRNVGVRKYGDQLAVQARPSSR